MPSPSENRAALQRLTGDAVGMSLDLLSRLRGAPEARRLALLDGLPEVIGYYSEGSAALAADFYEEERDLAGVRQAFVPELVVADRTVKTRRAIAWSSEPMFTPGDEAAALLVVGERLAEVIQLEVARPFRDTITTNRQNDPQSVGWKRVTAGGCKLCRMLADRGAVYREATAHFATHPNCHCAAQAVFRGGESGPEASVMQYKASRKGRTPAQKAALRQYLDDNY